MWNPGGLGRYGDWCQSGSIRIPAAMGGAVGLKPTHGLVPYTEIVSSEAVMDHVGFICKNVMDVAVSLEVLLERCLDDRVESAETWRDQIFFEFEERV